MSNDKHTPGPWAYYRDTRELMSGRFNDYHVHQAGPTKEANCYTVGPHVVTIKDLGGGKVHEANARLIAAAPNMLEVLRKVLFLLAFGGDAKTAKALVREAIAQAVLFPDADEAQSKGGAA